MGHTYRKNSTRFDDEQRSDRRGKHQKHTNNRKSGGMRILNDHEIEDDLFEDEIEISDEIYINKVT